MVMSHSQPETAETVSSSASRVTEMQKLVLGGSVGQFIEFMISRCMG